MKNLKNIKFFLLLVVLVALNAFSLCCNNKEGGIIAFIIEK